MTADHAGNIYFADASRTVYKVDARGILTRVAGNGHSGDGGLRAAGNADHAMTDFDRATAPTIAFAR